MSDPTPPPPAPAPKPKRAPRSPINQDFVKEVAASRSVAAAAVKTDYTAALTAVEFDATLPTQVTTLADQIDTFIGKVIGARSGKTEMTDQERAARAALIAVLGPIQTAAKRKFRGATVAGRANYFIGQDLANQSLDEVLTATRAIRLRLVPGLNNAPPENVLPGITALGKIKELTDAITLYDTKNTAQGDKQTEAGLTLENLDAAVTALADLRHQIQLAADQAWPWRTPQVVNIRKDFLLPVDRPLGE